MRRVYDNETYLTTTTIFDSSKQHLNLFKSETRRPPYIYSNKFTIL